jgi:hypothetical protein
MRERNMLYVCVQQDKELPQTEKLTFIRGQHTSGYNPRWWVADFEASPEDVAVSCKQMAVAAASVQGGA